MNIDIGQLVNYSQCLRDQKRSKVAMVQTLKALGDGAKDQMIAEVARTMTVRKPQFVKSSFYHRFPKLSNLTSEVGSVKRKKFSGWTEQMGATTERTRFGLLTSRKGDKAKVIQPAYRLSPGTTFLSDKDYPHVYAMLATLRDEQYYKPFMLSESEDFKPGLYQFVRETKQKRGKKGKIATLQKIKVLQLLEPPKDTKKTSWMTHAIQQTLRKNVVTKLWEKHLQQMINK